MVDTTLIMEINESTKPILKIKPKDMTPEERKERKKLLQRDYMNKRRKEDPEFARKQRELCNTRKQILRENTEYVQKEREYSKNYYKNMKRQFLEMKELLNSKNIGEKK